MRVALYRSERDNGPECHDLDWPAVVRLLTTFRETPCTVSDCPGKSCPHKFGLAWSPVDIEGTRANDHVRAVTAAVFDLDDAPDETWLERIMAADLDGVVHSSHSHAEGAPRLRLVLPLSRPVPAPDWRRFLAATVARFDLPADPSCKDLSRLYFLPSAPQGAPRIAVTLPGGRPLDVDEILASAPDVGPGTILHTLGEVTGDLSLIEEGGRNTALFRLGASLRDQGIGERALIAALASENAERFKPPLPDHEVLQVAASVMTRVAPTRDVAANAVFASMVEEVAESQVAAERSGAGWMAPLLAEVARLPKPPIRTYSTGMPQLDRLIGDGISTRQLCVIAAPPADGKSALAVSLALSLEKTVPVLYVSTELESDEMVARHAAHVLAEPWTKIVRGHVTAERVADALEGRRIRVIGCELEAMRTFETASRVIVESIASMTEEYGVPPVVVVDYLQDLARGAKESDVRGRVGDIATALRGVAQRFDCAMIVVSSVSRNYYGQAKQAAMRMSNDPRGYLAAAKESGDVDYAAATVLFLDVDVPDPATGSRPARIAVAKARHGSPDFAGARFHGVVGRWEAAPEALVEMTTEKRKERAEQTQNEADEDTLFNAVVAAEREGERFTKEEWRSERRPIPKQRCDDAIIRLVTARRLEYLPVVRNDASGRIRTDNVVAVRRSSAPPPQAAAPPPNGAAHPSAKFVVGSKE